MKMLHELNKSAPKSHPRKFLNFENFYLELYLDPGSCSQNTLSTTPMSLVPGESSCGGNAAYVNLACFLNICKHILCFSTVKKKNYIQHLKRNLI